MTEEEVRAVVLDVLQEVQNVSGREWNGLGLEAKPIGSLDGFDSLSAVEATVMMEEKLGCKLEIQSVFVSEDGKRALTLKEISARVSKILAGSGGVS
jgi:acyl carrier protein